MRHILFSVLCMVSIYGFAQADSTHLPPYKRINTLPPIQILLGDSTTKFTSTNVATGKPLLLMVFSTDCNQCKHMAEELPKYKEQLKDVQIVMATMHPLWKMNEFATAYKLKEMSNVVTGKDIYFLLPPFFEIHYLPFYAFYNKDGQLIRAYEGSMTMENILKTLSL